MDHHGHKKPLHLSGTSILYCLWLQYCTAKNLINYENFALITAKSGSDNLVNLLLTTGITLTNELQSSHQATVKLLFKLKGSICHIYRLLLLGTEGWASPVSSGGFVRASSPPATRRPSAWTSWRRSWLLTTAGRWDWCCGTLRARRSLTPSQELITGTTGGHIWVMISLVLLHQYTI